MKHELRTGWRTAAKNLLVAVLMIGAVAGASYGITAHAAAAKNAEIVMLPTTYHTAASLAAQDMPSGADGYVKPDYTLVDNGLEYYRDKKPTANDISREQAAEIGVISLVAVFGVDLNGKEIVMSYIPAENGLRAYWQGENGEAEPEYYYFKVDAITGELHVVSLTRELAGEKGLPDVDMELHESGGEGYDALASEAAVEYGAIQSAVKTVEYDGQGAKNNDPNISFIVTGDGGERAIVSLSLHDKKLVSITFEAGVKEMEAGKKIFESTPEFQARQAEAQKKAEQRIAEHMASPQYQIEQEAKSDEFRQRTSQRAATYFAESYGASKDKVQAAAEAYAEYLIDNPDAATVDGYWKTEEFFKEFFN